jgi:hypothetical protein
MQLAVIQNKIYQIREHRVMLDFDLAEMYEVETKRLNEQVKRNINRFPQDFMFRLTKKEWNFIRSQNAAGSENSNRSQIVTGSDNDSRSQNATSSQKYRAKTITPFAFTEHGVTMLASVLRSEKAIKVNIAIVRAFILLREYVNNYKGLALKIEELEKKYNKNFSDIFHALDILLQDKEDKEWIKNREMIGFKTTRE